jgi:hypothetical protein
VVVFHLILAITNEPGSTSPTLKTQTAEIIHQMTKAATIKKNETGTRNILGVF